MHGEPYRANLFWLLCGVPPTLLRFDSRKEDRYAGSSSLRSSCYDYFILTATRGQKAAR